MLDIIVDFERNYNTLIVQHLTSHAESEVAALQVNSILTLNLPYNDFQLLFVWLLQCGELEGLLMCRE
jgi:hypothetical protein